MTVPCRDEAKSYPDPQPSGSEINPEAMSEARRVYGATDTSQTAEGTSTSEEEAGSETSDTSSSSEAIQPGEDDSLAASSARAIHLSTPLASGVSANVDRRPDVVFTRIAVGESCL